MQPMTLPEDFPMTVAHAANCCGMGYQALYNRLDHTTSEIPPPGKIKCWWSNGRLMTSLGEVRKALSPPNGGTGSVAANQPKPVNPDWLDEVKKQL